MYGYVVPPSDALTREDHALFTSFYCGLCIRTGKLLGTYARLTTNYDITFLNVLLHDLLAQNVSFKASRCILSARKRPIVTDSDLLDRIAAVNVILGYYKAVDGIKDGEGFKYKAIMRSLRSAYLKSKQMLPEIDDIVANKYSELQKSEQARLTGLDRISDIFASMMRDVAAFMLGDKANENSLGLIYNIGKFVYLADALDDIDEDRKAGRYNPFLASMPHESDTNRVKFFSQNKDDIQFILNVTVNRAIECFNNLSFTQSYDLLRKIVHIGLRQKTEELLSSKKKLKKPTVRSKVNEKPL